MLEVILAIAILGGSLAVIGELVSIASRNARHARESTTAQILCEAKLAELTAGVAYPEAIGPIPCETDPEWNYTVEVQQPDQTGLLMVRVTVEPADTTSIRNRIAVSLVRWMLDPDYVAQLEAAEAAASGSTSATGSSSTSSTATGS